MCTGKLQQNKNINYFTSVRWIKWLLRSTMGKEIWISSYEETSTIRENSSGKYFFAVSTQDMVQMRLRLHLKLAPEQGNVKKSPTWYCFWRHEGFMESRRGLAPCGSVVVHEERLPFLKVQLQLRWKLGIWEIPGLWGEHLVSHRCGVESAGIYEISYVHPCLLESWKPCLRLRH